MNRRSDYREIDGPDQPARATATANAYFSQSQEPMVGEGYRVLQVSQSEVETLVRAFAAQPGTRLADFFGSMEQDSLVLRAVYDVDSGGDYLVLQWPLRGDHYPLLSDVAPAAFIEECEIYERFGVRPSGGKPLNRILRAPPLPGTLSRGLGRRQPAGPAPVHAPHFVAGEAIEFPYGPVRGVAQESIYFGLVTSGEEVLDLYLLQWHKHRRVEQRLEGLTPSQALFQVERTEGLSAVGNGWAFCSAAEAIAGLTPSPAAQRSRAVALELERLYNHAQCVAALAQSTGLSVAQAQAELALELLLRVNLAAAGHRYLFGLVSVGGVSRTLDTGALRRGLPPACDELRRVVSGLMSTNSFLDRLEATGAISRSLVERMGGVGPVARASGCDIDSRRDHPFGPYRSLQVQVPSGSSGDVLARLQVMVEEIEASRHLIGDLLSAGFDMETCQPSSQQSAGTALGWCESSRGEALAWLDIDSNGTLRRARLRPASARNWRLFDDAARSRNVFTDIPIIEASFWLTVAGMAR